jgi:hypothetical protein
MVAQFSGTSDLLEQPQRRSFSLESGWSTIRTWQGPKDSVLVYANQLAAERVATNIEVSNDGPVGTVSATYPDGQDEVLDQDAETLNVTWELFSSDLEKDLSTHYQLIPTSDLERANQVKAKEWVTNPPINENYVATGNAATDTAAAIAYITSSVAELDTKSKIIYDLMTRGTTSYIVAQYVIRKTIKVGRNSDVLASETNIGRVTSIDGVPPGLFQIPGNHEWLKKAPNVIFLGRGKYQIVQEWWGADKWSQGLYAGTAQP